ncbi:MAG TPA: DNA polymerase Y family protein [Anaeromyxobacteraceae bacterium]|nr:DNA polymerase Y family protein [Anaeromyxobacteraceae bacterium]
MQLELGVGRAEARPGAVFPRVLGLCLPDLSLQRVLRAREASGGDQPLDRRPLATVRDGCVVACEAEARERGVRGGEPLVQARAACADLEAVPVDDAEDRAVLEGLAEALLVIAPAVEIAGPEVLLLDGSGAHLFVRHGDDGERMLIERAVEICAEQGLRCRAALASGRTPARALARYGPALASVPPGAAAAALSALPVAALELAPDLERRLGALGVRSVGDLARLPPATLAHRFGPAGLAAWHLAQGDDPAPLSPYLPQRLPQESLDLEGPAESVEQLLFGLRRLADRLGARLAGRGLGATRLRLALRLDPSGEERVEIAFASPTSTGSRWLFALRERIGTLELKAPVAAVALGVVEAAPAPAEQLGLGERPQRLAALEAVLARLAARLGSEALFAAEPVDRHRPEAAYATGAFAAKRRGETRSGRERKTRSAARGGPSSVAGWAALPADLVRPTRLLARPRPLVALGEGGRLTALRLGERTVRVLALSPAERLCGEWWGEPFDRDYHRARLEGLGDCWIFRDAADGRLWLHGFFD